MLFATATAAMHHASSPLAVWPWLALAVIDRALIDRVAPKIPQHVIDDLGKALLGLREAFRLNHEGLISWEVANRKLTPVAHTANESRIGYRMATRNIQEAKRALDEARKERRDLLAAFRELKTKIAVSKQRVREARTAHRNAFLELEAVKRATSEAKKARRRELQQARARVKETRELVARREETLRDALRGWCFGENREELIEATARRLSVSSRYLRALLGERDGYGLTEQEKQEIVARRIAGAPAAALAAEYRLSRAHIYRILQPANIA